MDIWKNYDKSNVPFVEKIKDSPRKEVRLFINIPLDQSLNPQMITFPISNVFFSSIFFSICRIIVGAPQADTSAIQPEVVKGGAVFKCDLSSDSHCQIIPFDRNGNFLLLLICFNMYLSLFCGYIDEKNDTHS